jgi:hypothetical protein
LVIQPAAVSEQQDDLMRPDVLVELPDWLKAIATIQSIFGLVLLFLFGLGIRNRFRMK